jgi:putative transcriptional regulator
MTQRVDFFIPGERECGKPFHYAACGLDYVYLLNGVVREDDPEYGEIITIKDQDELHKSIGLHIIEKPTMTNKEFKFLRKVMGYTQEQMVWELGVNVQTVANYEKKGRIPASSQKLMC